MKPQHCRATGKVKFSSLLAAQIVKKKRKLKFVTAYRCRRCRGWHLGHSRVDRALEIQNKIDQLVGVGIAS